MWLENRKILLTSERRIFFIKNKCMQKNNALNELIELLEISSQHGDKEGINTIIDKVLSMMSDLPIEFERKKMKNCADFLIGRTKVNNPDKPMIILSGHLDVIFPAEDIAVRIEGNKLYGSGAQDMKGCVFSLIQTLRKLNSKGLLQNILIALSPAEESGPLNPARKIIQDLAKEADYIFVFESTLDLEPTASLNKRSVVLSRTGILQFDIRIEGPGGHSGVLSKKKLRHSTNIIAAEIILELEKLADYDKLTTLNVGKIEDGRARNVLSDLTRLECEARIVEKEEFIRIRTDLSALEKKYDNNSQINVSIKEMESCGPLTCNEKKLIFFEELKKIAGELGLSLLKEHRSGGSEGNYFEEGNPSAVIIDGMGIRGDGQHTKNEYLLIDSIEQTNKFLFEIIEKLLDS